MRDVEEQILNPYPCKHVHSALSITNFSAVTSKNLAPAVIIAQITGLKYSL